MYAAHQSPPTFMILDLWLVYITQFHKLHQWDWRACSPSIVHVASISSSVNKIWSNVIVRRRNIKFLTRMNDLAGSKNGLKLMLTFIISPVSVLKRASAKGFSCCHQRSFPDNWNCSCNQAIPDEDPQCAPHDLMIYRRKTSRGSQREKSVYGLARQKILLKMTSVECKYSPSH